MWRKLAIGFAMVMVAILFIGTLLWIPMAEPPQYCEHKWKIVREENTVERTYKGEFIPENLVSSHCYVVYHLQCENCGDMMQRKLHRRD